MYKIVSNVWLILALLFASVCGLKDLRKTGNITVAFFTDEQEESCNSKDTSKGLILTSSDTPTEYTCFNITDIFSQSNNTGFQPSWQQWVNKESGMNWTIHNNDDSDVISNANYSHIRVELLDVATEDQTGEDSSWVLYTYAFPDCQLLVGLENHQEDYPWYEASCQTEEGGECQHALKPIKSFAIRTRDQKEGCKTWAKLGSANRMERSSLPLVLAAVGLGIVFLVF
ncbi:hypothetical protein FHETE_4239 [Fusarium heterosporum]|uniref:Uncharacterized protein n=1 Tax=Fusarium heterosporum TaxID=42747 RepID=A0A8H5WV67_FUSHE|nr:hypothetical protein FHETE_4239 [Fusarium heterosporum]